MKKLMTVIAAVAMSFGLFAEPASHFISFETADACVDENGKLEKAGWEGDASVINLVGGYNYVGADARRTEFLGGDTNAKCLKLETGKEVVTCTPGGDTKDIFFDQVVKFTGYEEDPTVTEGKIAIWASAIEADDQAEPAVPGETNLYITCGTVDGAGNVTPNDKILIRENIDIDAWHRVTIKSLGTVTTVGNVAGFIVYIDGTQAVSTEAQGIVAEAVIDSGASNYNASGMLFPALASGAVTAVAYQGIGELDDVAIDDQGPEFARFVEGTVALVNGATLVVTNALGETVFNQATAQGNTFQVAPNSTLGFIYTAAEGKFLTGGVLEIAKDTSIAGQDKDFSDLADDIEAKDAVAKYDGDNVELYTDDLNEAFENTLGNVTLVADAVLTAPVDMADFSGEFDLADFKVSGTWATSYANPGAGRDYLFEIGSDAEVTVYGGTIESTGNNIGAFHVVGGYLSLDDVTVNASWRAIGAYKGATVEVGDGAVLTTSGEDPTIFIWSNFQDLENDEVQCEVTIAGQVSNTFAGPRTCANLDAVIMGNGNDKLAGVALTIKDGAEIEGAACAGIYFPCAGELSIGQASITGTEGVYVKGGASTIVDGAEITATGAAGEFLANHNGHAWTGDAFVVDVSKGYAEVAEQSITGGTFESTFGVAVASYKEDGATADRVTGFIEGGLFKGAALPETDLIAAEEGQQGKWVEDESNPGYYTPTTVAVYDITITKPENGTLETSVTNGVEAGTVVTITATPAKDYELESITVDDVALEKGVYTFTMPAKGVTVTATFKATSTDPIDDPTDLDEDGEANLKALKDALPDGGDINKWAKTVYGEGGKIPAAKLNYSTPELVAAAAKFNLKVMADPVEVKVEATETANCFKFTLSDADKANPLVAATRIQQLVQYTTALGEATPFAPSTEAAVTVAPDDAEAPTYFTATFTGKDTAGEAAAAGFMKVEVK